MQHLVARQLLGNTLPDTVALHLSPGKVPRVHRIKPHVPPLVRAPVNSFEFQRCRRTPQVDYLMLSLSR